MYYEINVAMKFAGGYDHLFATGKNSVTNQYQLKEVYEIIKEKFPSPEYRITVTKWEHIGHGISEKEIMEVQI